MLIFVTGVHCNSIVPPSWIVKLPKKGSFKSSLRKSPKKRTSVKKNKHKVRRIHKWQSLKSNPLNSKEFIGESLQFEIFLAVRKIANIHIERKRNYCLHYHIFNTQTKQKFNDSQTQKHVSLITHISPHICK